MFRNLLSLGLAALLLQAASTRPAAAGTKDEGEVRLSGRVKAGIAKLGTGPRARVEVKLRDRRRLKVYVGEAGEDGFTVVEEKTGAATRVAYPQVRRAKGHNLSEGTRIAFVAGIVAAAVILAATVFAGY